jgi:hypothetical protein
VSATDETNDLTHDGETEAPTTGDVLAKALPIRIE